MLPILALLLSHAVAAEPSRHPHPPRQTTIPNPFDPDESMARRRAQDAELHRHPPDLPEAERE